MFLGTASLGAIVQLAVPAAFLASLALLWAYRRAVRRSMRRQGLIADPDPAAAQQPHAPGTAMAPPTHPLEIGASADPAPAEVRGAWRGPLLAAAIQVAAGLAYAVTLAVFWWSTTGFPYKWDAIGTIALIFAWPLVIVLGLVAAISWRGWALIALGYGAVMGGAVAAMVMRTDLIASFAALVWYNANGMSTLLVLAFLWRPIRAMGPLVTALTIAAAIGVFAMNARMENRAVLEWVAETATALGFRGYVGGIIAAVIVYGLSALAMGLVCYIALRWVGRLYRAQWFSDQQIQIDAVWLIFALSHGIANQPLAALAAVVAYKLVALAGSFLLRRTLAPDAGAPRLLLLRVFSLGARSGRLFDSFARLWRYIGTVRMIAGPDLANSAVEPHEFLDFLAGRLQRRFISGPALLEQRLSETAPRRDPDGRFRVASFFCHADTWQMALRRLARDSDVVLMDLRGFTRTNQGCIYELHELLDSVRLEQVLLVVDATTDQGFLAEVLTQGWARINQGSPNRSDPAPRVRLYRFEGPGGLAIDRLVATLAKIRRRGPVPAAA
jgi:hypothetical protein